MLQFHLVVAFRLLVDAVCVFQLNVEFHSEFSLFFLELSKFVLIFLPDIEEFLVELGHIFNGFFDLVVLVQYLLCGLLHLVAHLIARHCGLGQ